MKYLRSKEDWAKTYVLDSAFLPFVRRNKNILPHWFIQAIQHDLLKAPIGEAAFDAIKVTNPSQDHRNQITINHHNPTNISEKNQISFYIPSEQSGTLTSLDIYNKDESNRPEPVFELSILP